MTGIHPGRIWRFETLGTQLARPQAHSATGGDSPPRPTSRHQTCLRMIARRDRVTRCIGSEIAEGVILKQRLVLTANIMDCRHYSLDTPMEGRWDREGRKTRGPRNGRRRFDERRETFAAQPPLQCTPDSMPAPQNFDTAPSLTRSPSSYDDDPLYDVELEYAPKPRN
ncbi:hypothetical protein EDD85DRAFT_1030061 [Armillaria nabsnona]|nr:hypothetical protein EDD85DRAFT_1030061 [Armillaria nabsnona]